jgi:16S rRNA (guanine966-N2)-methyltransferase
VRESIFSIIGDRVSGTRVLDLYAGTGAMGLEALSRGATEAIFVEKDLSAIKCLNENVRACGFEKRSSVLKSPVPAFLRDGDLSAGFGLVFADPPYGDAVATLTLLALSKHVKSLRGCLIVLEHESGEHPEFSVDRMRTLDIRKYGNTALTFLQVIAEGGSD